MGDTIVFNTDGLDNYASLLESAPDRLGTLAVAAVKKTLVEAKRAQQLDFMGSRNRGFRAISRSVHFTEPTVSGQTIRSRLGVRKGGAGSLANIAVYGTWKGGGTRKHPYYHLSREIPKARNLFAEAMGRALTS